MHDSITIAEVGSMVKVSGSRIATPFGPPSPGSTPTKIPSTRPTIIRTRVFHVIKTAKPCSSRPKASIRSFHSFRHCKERSDEAIQSSQPLDCFASLAMSVEFALIPEGGFKRALRHDDVEGDVEGHEHDRGEHEGREQGLPQRDLADQ